MSFLLAPLMVLPVVTQTLGLNDYINEIPVVGPGFKNALVSMNPMTMISGMGAMVSGMLGQPASSSSSTEIEVLMIAGAGVGLLLIMK